ncbi:MAG: hypothetical protein WCJ61_15225, partial [Paludibacter sp.]
TLSSVQIWFRIISILYLVSIASCDFALAQMTAAQETFVQNDSTPIYKDIETYSKGNKYTSYLYQLIFKPIESKTKTAVEKIIEHPYSAFEGKIIRSINIKTLAPFGNSISDTTDAPKNLLSKIGNNLHVNSRHFTIRNMLLIKRNQPFDSLLVKESERLVRARGFVRDVSFSVIPTEKESDSVDIYIRELDKWSIIPSATASSSSFTVNFLDGNILGLGHEFNAGYIGYLTNGNYAYNTNYFIPNIHNTYINSTLHFGTDEFGNFTRSFAIDRPFFSPLAKWAAGINLTQQLRRDYLHTNDTIVGLHRLKFYAQDYWLGSAIKLFKGNTENSRTTNFISTIRYLQIRYLEKPNEMYDPQHFFANEDFYLASIGISARKYEQDRFIFNYDVIEDVPIGNVISMTGGYQKKNNVGRFYFGSRISSGHYYPWGYLSFNCEYGSFYHASQSEQGILSAGVNYFTGLVKIGKWRFRQFVKPQLVIGINRLAYDSLTLNNGHGLDGFSSSSLIGTKRLLFTMQTQSFSPWKFIGFHFSPYFVGSLGMLGNDATGFKKSKVFSQFGVGVLIRNNNLLINTFHISFAFYPSIPGIGQNIFKINSFNSSDFGFRDFEIGKPSSIVFE